MYQRPQDLGDIVSGREECQFHPTKSFPLSYNFYIVVLLHFAHHILSSPTQLLRQLLPLQRDAHHPAVVLALAADAAAATARPHRDEDAVGAHAVPQRPRPLVKLLPLLLTDLVALLGCFSSPSAESDPLKWTPIIFMRTNRP